MVFCALTCRPRTRRTTKRPKSPFLKEHDRACFPGRGGIQVAVDMTMNSKETPPEAEFVSILGTGEKSDVPPRFSSRSLPEALPILGLSDIVIFPGAVVPLLVETGPSLKLIDDIVAGDRLFAAVLQRKPEIAEPMPEDLHDVGCVSRLSKMVKFPV